MMHRAKVTIKITDGVTILKKKNDAIAIIYTGMLTILRFVDEKVYSVGSLYKFMADNRHIKQHLDKNIKENMSI